MDNIYIGLVAPIGCDLEPVIDFLKTGFENKEYLPRPLRISGEFLNFGNDASAPFDKAKQKMDNGDKIRGNCNSWLEQNPQENLDDYQKIVPNGILALATNEFLNTIIQKEKTHRQAFIIRSFKRPEEIQLFRKIHPDNFFVISCFSDQKKRQFYMEKRLGITEDKFNELDQRDEKDQENDETGQSLADTFANGDFFVDLDCNEPEVYLQIQRIIELLFGSPFLTPTFDELAMFQAFTSSLRSGDLSRQVGAVLAKDKEVLAMGANDVPKFGGGLYWPVLDNEFLHGPTERDQNYEYDAGKKGDTNRFERDKLASQIANSLINSCNDNNDNNELIKNKISTGLKRLTEFGRQVHAEMEAILACARLGISCKGATLYTTTFPCHNCARHIIAAGITKVIFIEPYPKSLAFDLHRDSIANNTTIECKVFFRTFTGVGPRRFFDLFSINLGSGHQIFRKGDDGKAVSCESSEHKTFRFADVIDSNLEKSFSEIFRKFYDQFCSRKNIENFVE